MYKKYAAFALVIAFILNLVILPGRAMAWPSVFPSAAGAAAGGLGASGIFAGLAKDIGQIIKDNLAAISITTAKVGALYAVQEITEAIIGKGGTGGIVSDWNQYLYVEPEQQALVQMNAFFNTVSAGRASTLNYEGVGPNFYSYLDEQSKDYIKGTPLRTDIAEYVNDTEQLFVTGGMIGLTKFMDCGNNPHCHSLKMAEKYDKFIAQNRDVAFKGTDRGFKPNKKNGKIFQPAAIVAGALGDLDKLGTDLIMNASPDQKISAAMYQIGAGAALNIASRSLNYTISDDEGKQAIRDKNGDIPFSINYNLNSGVALNVGGVDYTLGAGKFEGQMMIGNTCATTAAKYDDNGAYVTIQGEKRYCETGSTGSFTGPSGSITLPSLECTSSDVCNNVCREMPGCQEKYGTLICHPVSKKCESAF